jgi:hypothetical protein
MTTLTGSTIASTYKDLLQVSNSNSGIDATSRAVEDGEGTSSVLKLSTSEVSLDGPLNEKRGSNIASASALDLEVATGNVIDISGTTTIDSITLSDGHQRLVRFLGSLTLTAGEAIALPTGSDIITEAGDFAIVTGYQAGTSKVSNYQRADGTALSRILKTRVVTAAGAVTVATTDDIVVINKTSGAATAANLPSTPKTGTRFIIKDGKGDAATNNITITPAAGNIDGAGTSVINTNYGSTTLVYNGSEWNII